MPAFPAAAPSAVNSFTVDGLTSGAGPWRIDWFGAVSYGDRSRSQPKIEVQLSKLPDDWKISDEPPTYGSRTWPETRQAYMPVGLLHLFQIGDVWQQGKLVHHPEHCVEDFDEVSISGSATSLVKAGSSEDESSAFYLPFSDHPYHLRHTNSHCILINHGRGRILIPAVEMIRFYFGSSSSLIARLFDAPFNSVKFWTAITAGEFNGQQKIDLAPGISGRSACDIARIALNSAARSAAELIGNSCVAATANGERAYPKVMFPFTGNTDLTLAGKWLPHQGVENQLFLVYYIKACTHPFPFSSLRYTLSAPGGASSFEKPDGSGSTRKRVSVASTAAGGATSISDSAADKRRKARELEILGGAKFPDLVWKKVSAIEDEYAPAVTVGASGSAISEYAVDASGSANAVQPIEVIPADGNQAQPRDRSPEVELFFQLTEKLKESGRFLSVELIRLNQRQRHPGIVQMPIIRNEDGEIASASLVDLTSKKAGQSFRTRARRICIGRLVDAKNCYFYAIPEPLGGADCADIHLVILFDHLKALRTNRDMYVTLASHFGALQNPTSPTILPLGLQALNFTTKRRIETGYVSSASLELFSTLMEAIEQRAALLPR